MKRRAGWGFIRNGKAEDQKGVGVILVDVDRFKVINDNYGHGVGDRVLIKVAELLKQKLRETDVVARWGGEEFLIGLLNTNLGEVVQVAEQLCRHLAVYHHPEVGQVTASFGVAITHHDGESLEILISRADKALYRAKHEGRNQVRGSLNDLIIIPFEEVL